MDATRVSVILGVEETDVVERLLRIIGQEGNGQVVGVAAHPVETAELVKRRRPDVVVVTSVDTSSTSIVAFLKSFIPPERLLILTDGPAEETEPDGATKLTLKDLELAEGTGHPPAPLSRAYVSALRDKRNRDIKTIEALAAMAEVREASTPSSVGRAADVACMCLREIDSELASCEDVRAGFVLHDVGKIVIPETILKKRSRLSPAEWSLMEKHPDLGVEIVKSLELGPGATEVIRHHHERWDGFGYPAGLGGEEIPLPARVFAVADAYESMISNRPYRGAMSEADALQLIKVRAGTVFDEEVVDVLLSVTSGHSGTATAPEIDLTG